MQSCVGLYLFMFCKARYLVMAPHVVRPVYVASAYIHVMCR